VDGQHIAIIAFCVSAVFNIVSLIVILFLVPKSGKIEKIYEMVHNLENRILTPNEIEEKIDLKIFKHMEKCRQSKGNNCQNNN
jgi:hypothetical protein